MRFQWKQIQARARSQSILVYAMDQGQTEAMGQPGPWGATDRGYCTGIVVQWIALRYRNKDFACNSNMECKRPPWQATRDHNLHVDAGGDLGAAFAESRLSVSIARRHFEEGPATAEKILTGVYKSGCYFIGLHATGGAPGHALGLEWEDPVHRLFDPNFGQFLLKTEKAFYAFFADYMDMTKYGTLYSYGTKILGIDRPAGPRIDPSWLSDPSLNETG